MKKLSFLFIATLFICVAQGQVRTPTLYVTGTVLSDEKMLVSVRGTKTIEGNVVTAELNGKKTETKTDNKGHALLDFSAISAGLVGQGIAVIKTFDKNGNLLGTANTTVQNGTPGLARPVIEQLPKNIPNGEVVTIPGQNLGADAKLTCGDQYQETLSASDREMTVFTNVKTGEQSAYVTTPNGVSESQTVNFYSLDFSLPKNSIKPRENVQANMNYESLPVGTKLIFTNKSPETIKMTIPGAENAANECVYTVTEQNGTLPVNITGILRGNFIIALDVAFLPDNTKAPKPAMIYEGIKIVEEKKPEDDEVKIFDKVEIEASFPGGDGKWRQYLEKNINNKIATKNGAPKGTYTTIVQFVVDMEGNISDLKALTNHGYGMEQEAIRAIQNGPKWNAAIQGSRLVRSYRRQPITFQVQGE
jgi:hypothetical protein